MERFHGGKVVSFRLPHETPLSVLNFLTDLKAEYQRKFSSEIADRFVATIKEEAEGKPQKKVDYSLNIPIPENLTPEEIRYLQNHRTKALIGQLIVQLLKEPTSEIKINSSEEEKTVIKSTQDEESEKEFVDNEALREFAQNTFLNFDDDDD